MRNPRFRAALLVLVVLSAAAAQNPQVREVSLWTGSAIISDLKGSTVLRSPQGDTLAAQRGLTLGPESVVETGKGSVLLTLQDGSQVLVKPHSRVVIKAPAQGKGYYLELLLGKLIAQVQKRFGNAPSFRMGTPTAVITVRGTRFSVEVTKKSKTIVDVYEGLVAVADSDDQRPVLIAPGFWTEVTRNRFPMEPREVLVPSYRQQRASMYEIEDGFGVWSGLGEEDESAEYHNPDTQRQSETQTSTTTSAPRKKGPG